MSQNATAIHEDVKQATADRIAALIDAVRVFNEPGLPSASKFSGVQADVSVHYLSDEDIETALAALGVEYETRDGHLRGDPFRVYHVEVGEGSIDFFGQTSSERHTFADHLAENAASFTEVQA